jgi:hypothetical protein
VILQLTILNTMAGKDGKVTPTNLMPHRKLHESHAPGYETFMQPPKGGATVDEINDADLRLVDALMLSQ